MKPKILQLCVNYLKPELTLRFLESARRQDSKQLVHFVVVDNSQDLSAQIEGVDIFRADKNLGYFGAFHWAAQKLDLKAYDWVILSNTDLEILTENFYESLSKYVCSEDVACLAPQIISDRSQRDANPYLLQRLKMAKVSRLKFIFEHYPIAVCYQFLALLKDQISSLCKAKLRLNSKPQTDQVQPQVIYAPHGAFMIFHRYFFERGGQFFHPAFLYGEEINIGEQCLSLGLKVIYEPQFKIRHFEHGSTGWLANLMNRKLIAFKAESLSAVEAMMAKNGDEPLATKPKSKNML